MFVGQDVHYLLDQLRGGHVVAVLGRSDQVVAHLLLVALLRCVLSAVGLGTREKRSVTHPGSEGITSVYETELYDMQIETCASILWNICGKKTFNAYTHRNSTRSPPGGKAWGHFCPRVMLINNSGHAFTNALRHAKSHTHNAQGGHFSLSEFVTGMGL